jgi:hypothetical protein
MHLIWVPVQGGVVSLVNAREFSALNDGYREDYHSYPGPKGDIFYRKREQTSSMRGCLTA